MARLRSTPGAQNVEGGGPSTTATRQATTRATRSQTRSVSVDPEAVRPSGATRQASIERDGRGKNNPRHNIRGNDGRVQALEPVPEDVEVEPLIGNDNVEGDDDAVNEDAAPENMALVRHATTPVSPSPSQMTNYTAFSQYELRTLDADLIMDNLEQLGEQAHRLLRLLVPKEATEDHIRDNIEQLYNPASRLSRRLASSFKNLASLQDENFGNQRYIREDHVLRALFEMNHANMIAEGPWRPDAIIYEANLANLVTQLSQIAPNNEEILEVLSTLDNNFPRPFMSSFPDQGEPQTAGSSLLFSETYYLALDLRTQLAIMDMVTKEPTTREELTDNICRIFMRSDVSDQQVDVLGVELYPRLWDGLPVLEDSINSSINKRVEDLRMPFDAVDQGTKTAYTARREIQQSFPWIAFQAKMLNWAQLRLEEIEAELNRSGGITATVSALMYEIERRKSDHDTSQESEDKGDEHLQLTAAQEHQLGPDQNAQPEAGLEAEPEAGLEVETGQEAAPVSTAGVESAAPRSTSRLGRKTWSKGGMSFLKMNKITASRTGASTAPSESRASEPVHSPAVSRHTPTHLPEDHYQHIDDVVPDEKEDLQPDADDPPQSPLKQRIGRLFAKSGNKENRAQPQQKRSLLDPQDTGERVRWDDDFDSQSQPAHPMLRRPNTTLSREEQVTSPRKRRHEEIEVEEPSEDEGFQNDARQPTTTRRRFEDIEQSRPRPRAVPIESSGPSKPTREASVRSAQQDPNASPAKPSARPMAFTAASSRRNPGQLIEPFVATAVPEDEEQPARSTIENHQLNASLAKVRTRTYPAAKEPRTRTPWSQDEIGTLIDLIGEHGCSWSLLKTIDASDDNVMEGREQLDLRDKARNMKVEFLMGTGTMPRNFDMVLLGQKEIRKLERYGIVYEQRGVRNNNR